MPQEQSEHCSPELSAYVEIDVTEDSSDDNCVIEQCIIRHRKRGSTNSVDLKNEAPTKNPGSSLPLKKRLSCCVFHGWTEFVAINAISARVIACFKAWQQNPYQCELCVKLLERFIDAAAAQNYTIDSIDYPESSVKPSSCQRGTPTDWRRPPAKASIAPSGKHVQTPVSKTDCFATRDEFRVRATCRRSHTFLCTGAHLKANLWCPICALRQELGGTLNKRTSKSEVKAQESFSQLQQKRLFEEARELFLNTARSSGFQRRDTDPLPPSFKHPKQNVSFPLKISSDANPAGIKTFYLNLQKIIRHFVLIFVNTSYLLFSNSNSNKVSRCFTQLRQGVPQLLCKPWLQLKLLVFPGVSHQLFS